MKYTIFLTAAVLAAATLMVGTIGLPQQAFAGGGGGDESTTEVEPKNEIDCTSSGFKYSQDCAAQAQVDTEDSDIFQ
jgi:uncharacterized membrane protein